MSVPKEEVNRRQDENVLNKHEHEILTNPCKLSLDKNVDVLDLLWGSIDE